jgi:hypothetical protein
LLLFIEVQVEMEVVERMLKRRVLAGITKETHFYKTAARQKFPAALCLLSMLFAMTSSVGANSTIVAVEVDRHGPKSATPALLSVEGAIDKVWIEYGVKVRGATGLRIHTKFSVKNALKVECVIRARVERADGYPIEVPKNAVYATEDGKVVVLMRFTPAYDPAKYPDTILFIPYWALSLRAENPNKMKVSVSLDSRGKEFARSALDFGFGLGKAR